LTATIDHTEEIPKVRKRKGTAASPPDAPVRRVHYRSGHSPWRRIDAVLCGLLAAGGVAGILGCWFGATEEAVWRQQTSWLIGAIFCAGLVGLGGGLWVLIGLRRVRQGFRDLRRDQRVALGLARFGAAAAGTAVAFANGDWVNAKDQTRAHRPDCLLLRGKQAVAAPPPELANYSRCGVCASE
jgi:hypothetical protein